MKTQNINDDSNWGIMLFKDTFEYLINGDMSKEDFCLLLTCIYNLRENGELPIESELPLSVRLVWKSLKHTVQKSKRNSKYYQKKKKGIDKEQTNDNYFCPWVENDMTEDEYKSQLSESELKAINAIR